MSVLLDICVDTIAVLILIILFSGYSPKFASSSFSPANNVISKAELSYCSTSNADRAILLLLLLLLLLCSFIMYIHRHLITNPWSLVNTLSLWHRSPRCIWLIIIIAQYGCHANRHCQLGGVLTRVPLIPVLRRSAITSTRLLLGVIYSSNWSCIKRNLLPRFD